MPARVGNADFMLQHLTASEYSMLRRLFVGEMPANPSMPTNVPPQVVPERRKIRGEEIEEAEAESFASSKMKGVAEKQTHGVEVGFQCLPSDFCA